MSNDDLKQIVTFESDFQAATEDLKSKILSSLGYGPEACRDVGVFREKLTVWMHPKIQAVVSGINYGLGSPEDDYGEFAEWLDSAPVEFKRVAHECGVDLRTLRFVDGVAPITGSVSRGDTEELEFYHEAGILDNSACDRGNTLVHVAAEYGAYKSLVFLHTKGFSFTARNNDGETPYDLLVKWQKGSVEEKLSALFIQRVLGEIDNQPLPFEEEVLIIKGFA